MVTRRGSLIVRGPLPAAPAFVPFVRPTPAPRTLVNPRGLPLPLGVLVPVDEGAAPTPLDTAAPPRPLLGRDGFEFGRPRAAVAVCVSPIPISHTHVR